LEDHYLLVDLVSKQVVISRGLLIVEKEQVVKKRDNQTTAYFGVKVIHLFDA
jgi:hypothetical protein